MYPNALFSNEAVMHFLKSIFSDKRYISSARCDFFDDFGENFSNRRLHRNDTHRVFPCSAF